MPGDRTKPEHKSGILTVFNAFEEEMVAEEEELQIFESRAWG